MIILAGISHAPGHTARFSLTFASSTASWYLCTLWAKSGCLMASSTRVKNSVWASFALPPSQRMLLLTFTCEPKMQYTKASIDWLMRERPACVKPDELIGVNQAYCSISSGSMKAIRFPLIDFPPSSLNFIHPG